MLQNYLNHEVLTAEEEQRLFYELKKGGITASKAKDRLVTQNLKLVANMIKQINHRNVLPYEDLMHEGIVGLLKAIEFFEVERNYRFSTYASFWIKRYIDQAVRASKSITIPGYVQGNISRMLKARNQLQNKHGRTVTTQEIADFINLKKEAIELSFPIFRRESTLVLSCVEKEQGCKETLESVIQENFPNLSSFQVTGLVRGYLRTLKAGAELNPENIMAIANIDVEKLEQHLMQTEACSLDLSLDEEKSGSASLAAVISNDSTSTEEAFIDGQTLNLCLKCLDESNLSERDKQVIIDRFGLIDGKERTFLEISQRHNISKERARQIQIRTLSNPSFLLALHHNGLINVESVMAVLADSDNQLSNEEVFNPEHLLELLDRSTLSTKEKYILMKRYNLDGEGKQTLAEISKQMDLSIQRIREIEYAALRKSSLLDAMYKQNILSKGKYERILRPAN